jgi:hypothetical protein
MNSIEYTPGMEIALIVLAVVVAVVAIDAIGRLDERRPSEPKEADITSTQKIVVDLRDRD